MNQKIFEGLKGEYVKIKLDTLENPHYAGKLISAMNLTIIQFELKSVIITSHLCQSVTIL